MIATKEVEEYLHNLKHGSLTIENDVTDAFESAKTMREFKEKAISRLKVLGDEVRYNIAEMEAF